MIIEDDALRISFKKMYNTNYRNSRDEVLRYGTPESRSVDYMRNNTLNSGSVQLTYISRDHYYYICGLRGGATTVSA